MKIKALIQWIDERLNNYNVFIPEEDEYDDETDEPKDPVIVLKHQRYATRLYTILFIVFIYVLFFIAFTNEQPRTVPISNITPLLFNQLLREDHESLSCPCSKTTVPYHIFVSNFTTFHPICSSIFVSEEWIKAVYEPMANEHFIMDFRTTAHAQFKFLADFCSLSEDIVSETLNDLGHTQLFSIELLSEDDVRSEVNKTVELALSSSYNQVNLPLHFFQMITRSSSLASALNTNVLIQIDYRAIKLDIFGTDTRYTDRYKYADTAFIRSCDLIKEVTPVGFYSEPLNTISFHHRDWPMTNKFFRPKALSTVDGFFGGCIALDAVLASTFACLYNIKCLETFTNYFPNLTQINLNWTNSVLTSSRKSIPLNKRLDKLLIENQSIQINYSIYFTECAPLICTYTINSQTNFLNAITLFVSLYGGLTIILRLMAPLLISLLLKLKDCSENRNVNSVPFIRKLSKWARQLNLFKTANDRTIKTKRQQHTTTFIYLIFLLISIVILAFYASFDTHTITKTELSPSFTKYKQLQIAYPNTIKCPCSNSANRYETFVSSDHTFHQVCSSDFINESWISMLTNKCVTVRKVYDWFRSAAQRFQLLSSLCQLANKTIDDAVQRLTARSFITPNLLAESDFNSQLNTTLTQFTQSVIIQFGLLVDTKHLFIRVDQPYTKGTNAKVISNDTMHIHDRRRPAQIALYFTGLTNLTSSNIHCFCATDFDCQRPMVFGLCDRKYEEVVTDILLGAIQGCFTIDSVLLSTLECFYSNSTCLPKVLNYLNKTWTDTVDMSKIPWTNARPLVYNPTTSRFTPQTPLSMIVKKMMIEEWDQTFSYEKYYEACAPNDCTYSYEPHTQSFIGVIITLVSMISSLIAALRFIIYQLVKFFFGLFKPKVQRQQQDRPNICNRIKETLRKLPSLLHGILMNLNMFPVHAFGINVDRMRATYLGKLATRLYIALLITGLVVLTVYSVARPRLITKPFKEPSFDVYNRLMHDHSDTLKCPCSLVSSIYDHYVQIEPIFHQICSSSFVSDEWRRNLTSNLVPDLSVYTQRDYRRFISAHLQFLTGLCRLSNQSVNASVGQFLSSLFVTPELLSQKDFDERVNSLIEQSKVNTPRIFIRFIRLVRDTNHGNAIISAYGTNFEYIDPAYSEAIYHAKTKTITYDGCSCHLNANCTVQAAFVDADSSSNIIPIMGLKIGCTPTESFLASTLACFYNSSCITLIYNQLNYNNSISMPLSINTSRFSTDTPVIDLVNKVFIENWTITINYSSYFDQCKPLLCSYTYVEQVNFFYTVTLVSGLYGGLSLLLRWLCPIIIRLLVKLYECRKKRINRIEPVQMATSKKVDTSVRHSSVSDVIDGVTLISTAPTNKASTLLRFLCYKVLPCILIIVAIIIPSVYLIDKRKNLTFSKRTTKSTNMAEIDLLGFSTIVSATAEPNCPIAFQPIVLYPARIDPSLSPLAVGDFNSDGHLDIAVVNRYERNIGFLFGNGDGTLREPKNSSILSDNELILIVTGHLNNDNHLDLVFANNANNNIGVLLGNGDGTFQAPITYSIEDGGSPKSIIIKDFNNDGATDLVLATTKDDTITLLSGNNSGTFKTRKTIPRRGCTNDNLVVGDFNKDGQPDFIDVLENICVLLSIENELFRPPTVIPVEFGVRATSAIVGDFNHDDQLDYVFTEFIHDNVVVLLGNGNGTFRALKTFMTGLCDWPTSIVAGDFNNDGDQDFAVGLRMPHSIVVMFGNGDGTFQVPIEFSTGSLSEPAFITTGDFNSDSRLDIVVTIEENQSIGILLSSCECCVLKPSNKSTLV